METYSITWTKRDGAAICTITGYFTAETGKELLGQFEGYLSKEIQGVIFDLTPCALINSLGVTALMNLGMMIMDDHDRQFILVGMNQVKRSVLNMVGFLNLVEEAQNLEEALDLLKT